MKDAALKMLWVNCVERLKDRVNNRTFWEALEQTRPIAIEGNILIIGLDAQNFNRASVLQQVTNMHAITEVVSELFNHPLQVRLVEGVSAGLGNDQRKRRSHRRHETGFHHTGHQARS